jgi:hypothetical protein
MHRSAALTGAAKAGVVVSRRFAARAEEAPDSKNRASDLSDGQQDFVETWNPSARVTFRVVAIPATVGREALLTCC